MMATSRTINDVLVDIAEYKKLMAAMAEANADSMIFLMKDGVRDDILLDTIAYTRASYDKMHLRDLKVLYEEMEEIEKWAISPDDRNWEFKRFLHNNTQPVKEVQYDGSV